MARPSEISPEVVARLRAVAQQRDAIPSDYELEAELGIPAEYIRVLMYRMRKRLKVEIKTETPSEPERLETTTCMENLP